MQLPHPAAYDVIVVHKIVGDSGRIGQCGILHLLEQGLVGTVVAAGNKNEGCCPAACEAFGVQPAEGVHHYVEAFVGVFISAAGRQQQGRVVVFLAAHQRCHLQQFPAGCGADFGHLFDSGGDAVLESVGSYDVHLPAEELLALDGSKVTYCRENIGLGCGSLLESVTGGHAVFHCKFVGVSLAELVVERQVVRTQAASDDGGVSREDRSDRDVRRFQVEQAGSGHPFVELGHNLLAGCDPEFRETLDDFSCGVAEQCGLDIFPVSGEGVNPVAGPQVGEYVVLAGDQVREIHEERYRIARHVPMTHAHAQAFFFSGQAPRFIKRRVFGEFRVPFGIAPYVRPDVYMVFFQFSGQMEGFRRKDGMDAAYLVANLPADFK